MSSSVRADVPVADWNRAVNDRLRAEEIFVEGRCEPYSA
jgi:hypothetical protein